MIMVADDSSNFFVQFPILEKLKASNPMATIKGLVVYMWVNVHIFAHFSVSSFLF